MQRLKERRLRCDVEKRADANCVEAENDRGAARRADQPLAPRRGVSERDGKAQRDDVRAAATRVDDDCGGGAGAVPEREVLLDRDEPADDLQINPGEPERGEEREAPRERSQREPMGRGEGQQE
ncbi:MAG: hypothetical protein M3Q55_12035 [Acidobacteriota bacterium]|nr:hypothetical protein [Acidobacteriota bacterium]